MLRRPDAGPRDRLEIREPTPAGDHSRDEQQRHLELERAAREQDLGVHGCGEEGGGFAERLDKGKRFDGIGGGHSVVFGIAAQPPFVVAPVLLGRTPAKARRGEPFELCGHL